MELSSIVKSIWKKTVQVGDIRKFLNGQYQVISIEGNKCKIEWFDKFDTVSSYYLDYIGCDQLIERKNK